MDGYLLIDKPTGWSSFDVVAKTRSVLSREYFEQTNQKKKIKVGHTGTLDPLASGLMVVVVGAYCKKAVQYSKLDKIYEVSIKLGQTSSTGDEEGIKTVLSSDIPDNKNIKAVIKSFIGEQSQIPPAFSAVKINGQRAYDLARAGQEVSLQPRTVTIYDIDSIAYNYPDISFTAHVSSGTYIRSLAQDIGSKLGVGAYMSALRRIKVGSYTLEDALQISEISSKKLLS